MNEFSTRQIHVTYADTVLAVMPESAARLLVQFLAALDNPTEAEMRETMKVSVPAMDEVRNGR